MATSVSLPTGLRGRVSDNDYEAILDELTAGLPPDLTWPLSIQTYAIMGRDATIDSVMQGYMLQMRRATWQLSGRDCDPKVVEQTAQDMDLPIVGAEATGAARVRGVSWPEHLRAALHSKLLYGHMGFELGVEIRDGLARLSMLAERLPQTITQIHADPKSGAFLGITQDASRRNGDPQIPARFMAWYCRDRIGTAWQGVSLFRSSWASFLVKKEMIRTHATANRRFGHGVPVNEALPGSNPSPAQMAEAQKMASASRVGETAGAASPPGFSFKLVGLSGGVPDTLAFVRWLDTQITRAALMPHLELGQNSNGGARALGEAFIESWTLALEALAEEAAVVATRQIAARLVEWNHGEDEPVPRVVVSGVGSRREVTAQSLQQLLASGALTADPALEAWIRREYRLPERDGIPKPAPSVQGDTIAAANRKPSPPAQPAVTTKPRASARRRRQSSGQLALPIKAAADDEDPVAASGVDLAAHQAAWEQARDALLAQWPDLAAPLVDDLVAQVEDHINAGDIAALGALVIPAAVTAEISAALLASMVDLAASGAAAVAAEAAHQGVTIDAGVADADRLAQFADTATDVVSSGYATGAAREAMLHAGPDADGATVAAAVREHLDALTEAAGRGWVATNLAGALSMAQSYGRLATFEALQDAGHGLTMIASEVNDPGRCDPCSDIDGHKFASLADAIAAYPTGRYRACLGADRCRGLLFAVIDQ